MANKAGTLEIIAKELGVIIEPLTEEFGEGFFDLLGLRLPDSLSTQNDLINKIEEVIIVSGSIGKLVIELIEGIEDEEVAKITQKGKEIIEDFILFSKIVKQLSDLLKNKSDTVAGLTPAQINEIKNFSDELLKRLSDFLIIRYLEAKSLTTAALLNFLGLAEREMIEEVDNIQPPYIARRLNFHNIPKFFNDPNQYLKDLYGWGEVGFDSKKFLEKIEEILNSFELPTSTFLLTGNQTLEAILFALSENKSGDIPSLDYELRFPAIKDFDTSFPISSIWSGTISTAAKFNAGLTGSIQPPFQVSLNPVTGNAEIKIALGVEAEDATGAMVIFGQADSSRLEIKKFGSSVGLVVRQEGELINAEPEIKLSIGGGKLIIDFSEGDGFLQNILSNIRLEGDFDLAAKWLPSSGLLLQGSGGIEISIPTNIDLGVLVINSFTFGLGITENSPFKIETSVGLTANLGPLKASIEQIGAKTLFNFPENRDGNLGPVDLSLGFKPPNGVGLSIDAGAVKGGGYLFFDFDREEYAGALELVFSDWIALKAIGLITTKMPDGSKGFSLLIIITVEFGTGIQLGFGFTLLGVGGLLGLNRTVKVDALREGIKTNAIESVMFPQDVVANAPKIISDLRQFFPPEEGTFLIGPMAKIGWGTPTLVSVSLGLIIEVPAANITILGVLKVGLPTEEAAILKLQVNFIGRIEPSNKLMWFYAELYDSRILTMTLEGGMGLLVDWGDSANFVFSVGGFHPKYTPPPLPFDVPPRLAINLFNESWLKLRAEGYFAVTSNSVQFGARLELFVGVSAFNIDGHFALDVLFQFNPFYFNFSLSISLSVKLFGFGLFSVGFSGMVEGPTPWHIKGKGKIGFWLFSVSIPFEHTWGESKHTELPPISILPLVKKEFEALTNWEAVVPKGSSIMVALRKLGDSPSPNDQLVLHPIGNLRISQRKVPLNLVLEKFGNQKPDDVNKLSVSAKITGGADLDGLEVKEKFATGEFRKLDDSKKLSSPGFKSYESGIELGVEGEQIRTGQAVKRIVRYETIIIDNNFKRFRIRFFSVKKELFQNFGRLMGTLFGHFLNGNAVTKSVLSQHYQTQIQPNVVGIQIQDSLYSVANVQDNAPMTNAAGARMMHFSSQAMAEDYLNEQIGQNAHLASQMHVIPNTEANIQL